MWAMNTFKTNKMASNKQQAGGYDCKWVTSPPDELLCLICLCVARDPHQHGNGGCGKVFCESCVTEYQKRGRTCPNCRKTLTTFKDERSKGNSMYTTRSIQSICSHTGARNIKALKVKCDNLDNGCRWIGS